MPCNLQVTEFGSKTGKTGPSKPKIHYLHIQLLTNSYIPRDNLPTEQLEDISSSDDDETETYVHRHRRRQRHLIRSRRQ